MKYGTWTLGQTEALINKLGGAEFAIGILQGNVEIALRRVSFPVWMTIEIGGFPAEQLLTTLQNEGVFVGDAAHDIMKKPVFTTLPHKQIVSLARCKVRDLGFTDVTTTAQLQERIKERSGKLCPAEVGPHLRRQLKDQKKGDVFWIVMEQITDSYGRSSIFELRCRPRDERWLRADSVSVRNQWNLGDEVVFLTETTQPSTP